MPAATHGSRGTAEVLSWTDDPGHLLRSSGLAGEVRTEDFLRDGAYVLRAELPGIDPDRDLEVYVEGDVLVVRGRRRARGDGLRPGSFERAVRLPSGADTAAVSAQHTAGVLEVSVPLAVEPAASRRRVPIQRTDPGNGPGAAHRP